MSYVKSLFVRTFEEWNNHDASTYGAALAYYAVLSMAPLLVIAVAIAGIVFRRETVQNRIVEQMTNLIGSSGADAFRQMMSHTQSLGAGLIATLVGIVILLISASGVFRELRTVLNKIWDVKPPENSGWWEAAKDWMFSSLMVLIIGFLLVLALGASAAISGIGKFTSGHVAGSVSVIAGNVTAIVIATILIAVIYRYVPEQTLPWRRLWPGSFATAVLITLGKYLLGIYLRKASVGSAYGAAGSLVVLLAWVYYASLLFLLGAEFTRVFACDAEGDCLNMGKDQPAAERTDSPLRKAS